MRKKKKKKNVLRLGLFLSFETLRDLSLNKWERSAFSTITIPLPLLVFWFSGVLGEIEGNILVTLCWKWWIKGFSRNNFMQNWKIRSCSIFFLCLSYFHIRGVQIKTTLLIGKFSQFDFIFISNILIFIDRSQKRRDTKNTGVNFSKKNFIGQHPQFKFMYFKFTFTNQNKILIYVEYPNRGSN